MFATREHKPGGDGFTLIEVAIVLAIVALMSAIAIPAYTEYTYQARVTVAIGDLKAISSEMDGYFYGTGVYPPDLATVGRGGMLDPWGHPYVYLRIQGSGIKGKGPLRKDRSLNPVNSDYDLYSIGRDGATALALTAKKAKDDVIRAGNGGYLGLAEKF